MAATGKNLDGEGSGGRRRGAGRWAEIEELRRTLEAEIGQLNQARQVALGQTEVILRTLRALTGAPDLGSFLGEVLKALAGQLGGISAGLWFDGIGSVIPPLQMEYQVGEITTAARTGSAGALARTLAGVGNAADDECQAWTWEELAGDGALAPYREWLLERGIRTLLVIPLCLDRERLGSVVVCSAGPRDYQKAELNLAMALGQQVVLAIELTRLSEKGQQAALLEERTRMAREIHDTLAQDLAGIILQLEAGECFFSGQPEELGTCLRQAREMARKGLDQARHAVWELHPEALEYSQIHTALPQSLEEIAAGAPVQVEVRVEGVPRPMPPEVGLNLLRIGQEAVVNGLRHSQARQVRVDLLFGAGEISLRVKDDGKGFDVQQPAKEGGFGLLGMQERARLIGARLSITTGTGTGTEVAVWVQA